jgi:predicted GNAT family acetyltransferase
LNDWSFTQLCSFAGAAKDTVNRLCPETAARVLTETLADRVDAEMDLQALVMDDTVIRAVNGGQYRRLWNADVVAMLVGQAMGFEPPPKGFNGATGLYAGEQDLFAFMIDPNGWIEVGGEAFAPGFFVFNSEVGKRSVGITTFWFEAVCSNHIVWDATDITEFTRKHTGKVSDALTEIRRIIENLVRKRDERKDRFAHVIAKAMATTCGATAEEVEVLLAKKGFTRALAKHAAEIAREKGSFTIWSVVDALTQLAREQQHAGARADADEKASSLLELTGT